MVDVKKIALFVGGVVFGSAGFKVLASKDAKKVYTQTTAAVLRMKDSTMETVNKVQEQAGDILADAKAINEARAAEAAQEIIEDAAETEACSERRAAGFAHTASKLLSAATHQTDRAAFGRLFFMNLH